MSEWVGEWVGELVYEGSGLYGHGGALDEWDGMGVLPYVYVCMCVKIKD